MLSALHPIERAGRRPRPIFILLGFGAALALRSAALGAIDRPASRRYLVAPDIKEEPVAGLTNARVAIADDDLIARDFPYLDKVRSRRAIEDWMVAAAGWIALPHLAANAVNSEIISGGPMRIAYRPPLYRRALIFEVEGGVVDSKGNGALNPRQAPHANGLITLGEALREYFFEKLIALILRHAGIRARTVGSYGVLDLGFDVIQADGTRSRAGALLRQAKRRLVASPFENNFFLGDRRMARIENAIRRYGVTSAGDFWLSRADHQQYYANIQGTIDGDLVDFAHYLVVDRFEYPTFPYRRAIQNARGTEVRARALLGADGAPTAQPIPSLQIPLEIWGAGHLEQDPTTDRIWNKAHDLAAAFAIHRASRDDIEAEFRRAVVEPMDAIEKRADAAGRPRGCGQFFKSWPL